MIKSFPFSLLFITSSIFNNGITCKGPPEYAEKNLVRERRCGFHSHSFATIERNRGAAKLEEKLKDESVFQKFDNPQFQVSFCFIYLFSNNCAKDLSVCALS